MNRRLISTALIAATLISGATPAISQGVNDQARFYDENKCKNDGGYWNGYKCEYNYGNSGTSTGPSAGEVAIGAGIICLLIKDCREAVLGKPEEKKRN